MHEEAEVLVFELENTRIYFHHNHKTLHLKWKGPDCKSIYVEVIEALKRLTLELKAEGWLFDLSQCSAIQTDIGTSNMDQLAEALKGSNLKKYARVVSKDQEYEQAIRQRIPTLNRIYNLDLQVGNFETEAEALAWLFDASEGTLVEE